MTRNESDKEDLIRDATAMVDRAEFLTVAADKKTCLVTAGFRKDRALSLYFDQDPFYQFDAEGRLRRAYENGFLFRSQGTTLARLNRTRTTNQTTLNRSDLTSKELGEFRLRMTEHIDGFQQQLKAASAERRRAVTDKPDFDSILSTALAQILNVDGPFLSTAINKRK